MKIFVLVLLTVLAASAAELDPAWRSWDAGDGAALLRQLTDHYRKQSLIPEARDGLRKRVARLEAAEGPDAAAIEPLCVELAELFLAQGQLNLALDNLTRANRMARIHGRLEAERELRLAGLLLKATRNREACEALELLTASLEREYGLHDSRTEAAIKLYVEALKRDGHTERARAWEGKLAPASAEDAGKVREALPGGAYAVDWRSQPPAGSGVEVRRGQQVVARAVVTPSGEVHVVGVVGLEPGDSLRYEAPVAAAPAAGPHESESYRRAEANWNEQLASGKVKLASIPAAQERLERIGARVAQASNRNVPWHFFIVKDKSPNAACLGEGFVFVTTGLLQLGLTDDELAGVIGHEIAHGTEQHLEWQHVDESIRQSALRELKEAQALQARYQREYAEDGNEASYRSKMATVNRRISSAEKKAQYLQGKKTFSEEFDQQQEIEADQVGMRYAVTAGYTAEGLMAALEKLHSRHVQRFGYGYSAGSRTHPSVARRVEVLKKVQASWGR